MRLAVIVLALCIGAIAQGGCPTKGTLFSESFGDGSSKCGTSDGATTCDTTWTLTQGAAGSASIIASPISAATPWCNYSLEMITGTGNTYIQNVGLTPTVPSATTFDVTFPLNIKSTGLSAFNSQSLITFSSDIAGGTFPIRVDLHSTSGGTVALRCSNTGAQGNDTANLSLNAQHTIVLHAATGASASYVTVDGGAQATCTQGSGAWQYQTIGSIGGNLQTIDYVIGNLKIDSATAGGGPPYLYCNFETSSNGTNVTPTIMANSCNFGNGTWTAGGASQIAAAMTICTAAQQTLLTPITIGSTIFTDTGTRGICFDTSLTTSYYMEYDWISQSNCASYGYMITWTFSLANGDAGFYSMNSMGNLLGSDFLSTMWSGNAAANQVYIETQHNANGNPDFGSKFTFTPVTRYWVTGQMQKWVDGNSIHSMSIYNGTTGALLSAQQKIAEPTNPSAPINFKIGRIGDSNGTTNGIVRFDNFVADYNTCIFPLGPKFTADSLVTGPAIHLGPTILE